MFFWAMTKGAGDGSLDSLAGGVLGGMERIRFATVPPAAEDAVLYIAAIVTNSELKVADVVAADLRTGDVPSGTPSRTV